MGYLETVEIEDAARSTGRSACRCSGSTARTSTSAASPALIASGIVKPGDRVRVLPSGTREHGRRASSRMDGDLDRRDRRPVGHAHARRRDRRQPRRRDRAARRPAGRRRPVRGHVVWMRDEPMLPGRPYWLKIGHQAGRRRPITEPKYKVNVNTLEHLAAKTLELNEIGVCNLIARPADRVRSVRGQPRDRRLHPDRPADQRARSAPA